MTQGSTTDARPDVRLVSACLDGDDAAWERLVDRYGRLVYSVIRRYGLDEEEVADVYQDVWMALWEELSKLRDHARLAPWLITVAGRLSWQTVGRRVRRRESGSADELIANVAAQDADPEQQVIARERQAEIRAALAELPPRSRELIHALFYGREAPTYAEIAERLGCSPNSIGPVRGRCFRELRAALARGERKSA